MRRSLTAVALVSSLLLLLACSSDDPPSKGASRSTTSTTEKATTTTSSTTPVQAKVSEKGVDASDSGFCKAYVTMQTEGAAVNPNPKDPALIREHYGKIADLAREVAATGPQTVRAPAGTVARLADEAVRTGSLSPFDRPEGKASVDALANYAKSRCRAG